MKSGPTHAFVLARVCAPAWQAWLPVSDSGSWTGLLDGTPRDCFSRIAIVSRLPARRPQVPMQPAARTPPPTVPHRRQTRSDVRTPQGGCSRSIPGSLLDLGSDFRFDLAVSHRLSRSHNEQHRCRAHRVVRRAATALVVRLGFVAERATRPAPGRACRWRRARVLDGLARVTGSCVHRALRLLATVTSPYRVAVIGPVPVCPTAGARSAVSTHR